MKVVLDSNILLVAISKKSRYHPIWQAFLTSKYQVVVTGEILWEFEEILQEHAAPGADKIVLEIFAESPDALYQTIYYNWKAIEADADDDKFFDAVVASNADYLVTDDSHFNEVKKFSFPKVNIISGDEFLNLLIKNK